MYKKIFLFSIFLINYSYGQLNGNYTIGDAGSDYLTIQAAVDDLTNIGVSGPVIFNIKDGTYPGDHYELDIIPGSSNVNTITFQSESLDHDAVILDGRDIFDITENASNIIFRHIWFDTYINNNLSSKTAIDSRGSNITIDHCKFSGGASGFSADFYNDSSSARNANNYINLFEGSNVTISNCLFWHNAAYIYKASNTVFDGLRVINNEFPSTGIIPINIRLVNNFELTGNTFSGRVKYQTIGARFLSGQTLVSHNHFFATSETADVQGATNHISLWGYVSNGVSDILFKNNFVANENGPVSFYSFGNVKIINNSFKAPTTTSLYLHDGNLAYTVYNNIFLTDEAPNLAIDQDIDLSTVDSNNNAFSKSEAIYRIHSTNSSLNEVYSLDDWKTFSGKETNSEVVGLVYASDDDLHTPNAFMLDGTGIVDSDVTIDIDNETRNNTTPDIGADEFDMDYSNYLDVEIVNVVSPDNTLCNQDEIKLLIKNNSSTTINSFNIEAAINGIRGNVSQHDYTILPNESVEVIVNNCTIIPNTLLDKIDFYISLPNGENDNNFGNNHASIANVFQLGDFDIKIVNDACNTGEYTLRIPKIPNTTVNWSTNEMTHEITVNQPGTYSVTVTDGLGCEVTKEITIN